jgi:hypothetical protein
MVRSLHSIRATTIGKDKESLHAHPAERGEENEMQNNQGNHFIVIHNVPNSENQPEVILHGKTEEEARALAKQFSADGYRVDLHLNNSIGISESFPALEVSEHRTFVRGR